MKFIFLILLLVADTTIAMESSILQLKNDGNQQFAKGNYQLAIQLYSMALREEQRLDLLRNRGMAYFHLDQLDHALADFRAALVFDINDAKTNYWLSKIRLKQNKMAEAVYHIEIAQKGSAQDDPVMQSFIVELQQQFRKLIPAIPSGDPKIAAEMFLNLGYFAQTLAIEKVGGIFPACEEQARRFDKNQAIATQFFLDNWEETKFSPVHLEENPVQLAGFIGSGSRVTTVIVQTLPILLANHFKEVRVRDISAPQIIFQNRILMAMEQGELPKMAVDAKTEFLTHNRSRLATLSPKVKSRVIDAISNHFSETYEPIRTLPAVNNIVAEEDDIFSLSVAPLGPEYGEVIFISTILSLDPHMWPYYYRTIRKWLESGATVVYTVLPASFVNRDFATELLTSFDEFAHATYLAGKDSVGMVHVKLSPRDSSRNTSRTQ